MNLNQLKWGVKLGVLASAGLLFFIQNQARNKLEEENRDLRRQVQQLSDLTTENERLSSLLSEANQARVLSTDQLVELMRLRSEVSALRHQTQESEKARAAALATPSPTRAATASTPAPATRPANVSSAAAGNTSEALTGNYWPQGSWQPVGNATPEAALQSQLWAALNGDIETLLTNAMDRAAAQLEADMKRTTPSQFSAEFRKEVQGFRGVRVIDRQAVADNRVVLNVALEMLDGSEEHRTSLSFRKVGDGWKLTDAGDGPQQ